MEELPEGTTDSYNPNNFRIRPTGGEPDVSSPSSSRRVSFSGHPGGERILEATSKGKAVAAIVGQGLQFSDKEEHLYFWFPLLAGLSELTFDPRQDIR